MADRLVVAADNTRARVFIVEKVASLQAGSRLVEKLDLVNTAYTSRGTQAPRVRTERNTSRQAGPMHPQGAARERHRDEVERRFGREIALHLSAMAKAGGMREVVVAAEPRMLGFLRPPLRKALGERLNMREIAHDYSGLTPARLHARLAAQNLI